MWAIQPKKKWKMQWTCSIRCCLKWRSEGFVGCYDQCNRGIKARKPYIVVENKNERSCATIDIAIPGDIRVSKKEKQKIERYQELKTEIRECETWKALRSFQW